VGCLERRTASGRGRTAQLHLTATGRELLAHAQGVLQAADRELAARLGPDDHRALSGLLLRAFIASNHDGREGSAG